MEILAAFLAFCEGIEQSFDSLSIVILNKFWTDTQVLQVWS